MSAALMLGGLLAITLLLAAGLALFTLYIRRRVEAAVPPLGRFVQVGETRLHIVEILPLRRAACSRCGRDNFSRRRPI
jgi:hypothetical protein